MPLEHLEDAARVFERRVGLDVAFAEGRAARTMGVAGGRLAAPLFAGHRAAAGRGRGRDSLVLPAVLVIVAAFGVVATEQAAEVVGVLEVLAQDGCCIGVRDDVLAEFQAAAQHVIDEPTEERDVAA